MGAKAEISWKRVTEDGIRLQIYVQHVGGEWRFFRREKRYDQWQAVESPPLDDWLALLDSIRRRIGRGLLGPQEEPLVIKSIRERFPDAEVA